MIRPNLQGERRKYLNNTMKNKPQLGSYVIEVPNKKKGVTESFLYKAYYPSLGKESRVSRIILERQQEDNIRQIIIIYEK